MGGTRRSWAALAAVLAAVALVGVAGDVARPGVAARSVEADALRSARLSGEPVPIPELTSETAEYAALPNGDMRVTISAGVVRVRRNAGWVPVDLTLVRAPDGSVAPVAHPGGLRIAGARPAGTHELAAVGVGARRVAMSWTGVLPEPVLSGNRATYVDAVPGADLVVEATQIGFQQLLVVKERAAVGRLVRVRLPVTGPGVASSVREAGGSVSLKDAAGSLVATVPAPAMWDAGSPARTAPIRTTVDTVAGGAALTLTPDLAWLRDPATTFPVTLDPTVNPLSTTFDTYVREGVTVDRSDQPDLQVGLLATAPPTIARSFLSWDTSMLAGRQINSATISFWNYWSHTCAPQGWEIWTTGVANADTRFTNQPEWRFKEATSTATRGFDSGCDDAWATIDGTSFFQRAATAGGTRGYMGIRAADESDANGFKQFRSRNGPSTAEVPKAVVTYNAWPTVTARATDPATACATGPQRPLVNTLTPQLKATVSDDDGTAMSVTFEWWAVDGAAPIGSATVTGVASGATAATAVPAGAFLDGGSYRWRVRASDGVSGSAVWSSFCELTVYVIAPPVEGCVAGVDSDYNGDGVRDLAIADPRAAVDAEADAGLVRVVDGGTGAVRTITADGPAAGDRFGHALSTFDVNRDGCADLAVGAPYRDVNGVADAGAVWLLLGAPGGLDTGPASLLWHQDVGAVAGAVEAGDWFGFSVAAGHTAAGEAYLVIGVPGEDIGTTADAGMVNYLRGAVNVGIDQEETGATDVSEVDDRFGYSVSGSVYHFAAGRPGEGIGATGFAGAASIYGHDLLAGKPRLVADLTATAPAANDTFGKSVSLAGYRPAGAPADELHSLLVSGVPGRDAPGYRDAGAVERFHVTATTVERLGTLADPAEGAYFGERVLAHTTTSGAVMVAVGAPGRDSTANDAGRIGLFSGTAASPGMTPIGRGAGLPGDAAASELLGLVLGSSTGSLYVASPYGDPVVYALAWTDLAAGTVIPERLWRPGADGIPADEVAFGAAVS
ncbi:DNRLRE domain-containing protein [Phytohabitans aurantiacus]|uniref:FG-GAP repeat protein n=1 Tax=Phytohabitans aurantiacus TaxID=3016789 RepID=A0ABQ5R7A8_9ACTN|nr:DNRLRE domain-containing protein [Phytohabitans aurantiacus]GLI02453.1 hypothetical protein Pa4123_77310 [Phytohabitans aurantiacus]